MPIGRNSKLKQTGLGKIGLKGTLQSPDASNKESIVQTNDPAPKIES